MAPLSGWASQSAADCPDLRGINSSQICMGNGRAWHLTGDDSVAIYNASASYPIKLSLKGDSLEIQLSATTSNPDNIDKFYLVSGDLSLLPPGVRLGYPDQILGPYSYGAPPTGNSITLDAAALNKLFDWQNNKGGIVVLEEQVGKTIDNPGVETFTGLELLGTPPAIPPTTVTDTSGANVINSGTAADPVNTFTGELFDSYPPDLALGGPMPLHFQRYYASGLAAANVSGVMGDNWRHNFEWTLAGNGSVVDIVSNRGRLIRFTQNGGQWQLSGRQDIPYQLTEEAGTGQFTLTDPGSRRSYRFNGAGQLLAISDNRGNTLALSYDASGLLTTVSDGLGRSLSFTHDAGNRLVSVSDDSGRSVAFAYTGSNLTAVTDAAGNTTTFSYTAGGLMTSTTRPLGNTPFSQTWSGDGKVASQTDALGDTTRFAYSGADTTVTDPAGNTMTHTHTAGGELSGIRRKDGSRFALASNGAGQRSGITDSLGATTGYDYHAPSGKIAAITHANGATTSFAYSARATDTGATLFDLTAITHADGTSQSFTYDSNGNLTAHTDQAGNTWSYSYNNRGQPLTATNPLGGSASRSYNGDATLASVTDASGNTTTYAYDALRRPTTVTLADGNTVTTSYDPLDRPLTITDPRGNTTRFSWDANGNLSQVTHRSGAITTHAYDAMDRLSATTDPLGNVSTIGYDKLGRPATLTTPEGHSVTLNYDAEGRLTGLTDGNGNTWQRAYDSEGIPTSATTPLGNTTTFTSDEMGRITAVASPLGHTTRLAYDAMGRITQVTDPLGNITSHSYDARGLTTQTTLPGNISASYERDALGNITRVTDPNGNTWQRDYDKAGRLAGRSDPLGRATTLGYDARNRVSSVTFPGGLGGLSVTFDPNGNPTRLAYSDGTELNFTYDAEDHLIGADGVTLTRDALGRITASNGITIAYDGDGRITTITYATGKSLNYQYDANGNVTRLSDWLGGVTTFTWDADNRLTDITRPNGVDTSYQYDDDGRLIAITHGSLGTIDLTRDANGRITAASRSLPLSPSAAQLASQNHNFDAAAQISSPGFSYDALGRLTSDGTTAYTWDLASRLTQAGGTGHTYDALGQRLSRTTGGITRHYVWNYALPLPGVAIERDGAGNDLRYYIHTPGGSLLYAIEASDGSRHDYHFDEAGNTRFVTGDNGSVTAAYTHTPFGVLLAATGALDNPFTWQGQWGIFDDGNGLYYIRARYYDASTGRFISKDPVKSIHPLMINPYQYAVNSPANAIDPTGEKHIDLRAWHPVEQLAAFLFGGYAINLRNEAKYSEEENLLYSAMEMDPLNPGRMYRLLKRWKQEDKAKTARIIDDIDGLEEIELWDEVEDVVYVDWDISDLIVDDTTRLVEEIVSDYQAQNTNLFVGFGYKDSMSDSASNPVNTLGMGIIANTILEWYTQTLRNLFWSIELQSGNRDAVQQKGADPKEFIPIDPEELGGREEIL